VRGPAFGFDEDLPAGAWALLPGFLLALMAVGVYVGPPSRPAPYHPLLTVHGTVTEVVDARQVHVWIDTIGGAAPPAQVEVVDPGLDSVRGRLSSLPLGERVVVQFDPMTKYAWRLERGDGKPGYSDAEISRWQYFEGGATAHRHGLWMFAAAAIALVIGFVAMTRLDDAGDQLDPMRGRSRMR